MVPAIEWAADRAAASDIRIVEATHGIRAQQTADRAGVDRAVMVIGPIQIDHHVALLGRIADAPDETAPGNRIAFEPAQLNRAMVFDVDHFRMSGNSHRSKNRRRCETPK